MQEGRGATQAAPSPRCSLGVLRRGGAVLLTWTRVLIQSRLGGGSAQGKHSLWAPEIPPQENKLGINSGGPLALPQSWAQAFNSLLAKAVFSWDREGQTKRVARPALLDGACGAAAGQGWLLPRAEGKCREETGGGEAEPASSGEALVYSANCWRGGRPPKGKRTLLSNTAIWETAGLWPMTGYQETEDPALGAPAWPSDRGEAGIVARPGPEGRGSLGGGRHPRPTAIPQAAPPPCGRGKSWSLW